MEAGTIQSLMEAFVQVKPTPVAIAEITIYSLSFRKTPPYGSGSSASGIWGPASYAPLVMAIVETAPMVIMQTRAMLAIIISH